MRKNRLQALPIVLTVLLINLFIIPSRAYANIWNLPNGLLDLFDSDAQYSSYTAGARDAQTKAGQPSELAVFLMTTQEHYELFVCRETVDHVWRIECQQIFSLILKSLMKMPSGFIIAMAKEAKLIRSRFLIINGF